MKKIVLAVTITILIMACEQQISDNNRIVTSDIDNFWEAYDQIITTADSAQQYQYLKELYLDRGTPGLEVIRWARRYTPEDYINAINNYPAYWNSIRAKTMKSKEMGGQIEKGVEKLRKIYPNLKPAKVYFEIGVFRTPGTTLDSMVLIGAEMALGDEHVDTSELPMRLNYVKNYLKSNPVNNFVFLNVHEFVHTQQENHDYILLYRSVYEGVAEWIAEKATGVSSQSPAIKYGKANNEKVRARFERELYGGGAAINNWLYNGTDNEFGTRDLGYYIGHAICDLYYEKAANKEQAIIDMVDLDYSDEAAFNKFVDQSGYFSKPLNELKKDFISNTPEVVGIKQFKNGSRDVNPNIQMITVEFSKEMNVNARGFDFGPLGEESVLSVKKYLGFSEDKKSVSFEVKMEAGKHYQLELSDDFAGANGAAIKPYLIDIKTKGAN